MARHRGSTRTIEGDAVSTFLDLFVTGGLALVTLVASLGVDTGLLPTPIRVLLGLLFVFVLPGYAVTAALFPAASTPRTSVSPLGAPRRTAHTTVSPIERGVLTVGLSLTVVSLVTLSLALIGVGISQFTVLAALCAVDLSAVVVAAIRRLRVPRSQRFHVRYDRFLAGSSDGSIRTRSLADVLTVVLLLVTTGFVGVTLAESQSGERYTELSLLTENGVDGTLVADDYPNALERDRPRTVYVGIENHEARAVAYTVVIKLQRFSTVDGEQRVVEEAELDRFSTTLGSGEGARRPQELTAGAGPTGEELRLIFLLYTDTPPETPTAANAYRSTHIWVNVTEPAPTRE